MKKLIKIQENRETRFILVNTKNEVYTGLMGAELKFSENWDEGKIFYREEQVEKLQRMYYTNLEKLFI
jgi:hypothetical protein